MRMIVQISAPSMKYSGCANVGRTDVFRVLGQRKESFLGSFEQCLIASARIRTHEHSKLCRDGERQHEVSAREQLLKLALQPSLGFAPLADWTVPVSARFQNMMELVALLTTIDDATRVRCPAPHDRNHRLDLIGVHTASELFQVGRPVIAEDFTDRRGAWSNGLIVAQGFLFMIRLILAMAASSPTVVTCR